MKMNSKRLFALLPVMLMVLSVSACGKGESVAQNSSEISSNDTLSAESAEKTESQSVAVKSDGYEKFSQLKIGMTESDVNAILGEPTEVDKAYYYYNVTVNGQDLEIQVWINTTSGLVTYISGDFYKNEYRAEFADSATDLSTVGDLESGKLDTYEACADAFKTPGYLISIDEDDVKRYLWVDSTDGYLCVTFNADGSVKSYDGVC